MRNPLIFLLVSTTHFSHVLSSVLHPVTLKTRDKYAHSADVIQIAPRRTSIHAGLGEMSVLARKRSFDYTPLVVRDDGVTEIGSFDLGVRFDNQSLFAVPLQIGSVGGTLSASCISCFTTGIAKASTTGFETNDTLIGDIADATKELLTDPDGFLASVLAMNVVVSLENLGGHFEFAIGFDGSGSISVPIFHPITPLGGDIQGNEVGIIFTIDLVFTVEAALGFTTGFDINFPKGASFSFNPISGDLLSMSVDGIEVAGIPFTFSSGGGTFTVALRIGLKAGLGVNIIGTGFELETGVYVDIPTYNATVTFDPEAACQLDFEENFFGVVAAFAQVGVSVDYINWQAGPSTAVTFFTGALPGGCIASKTSLPGSSNVVYGTTTAVYATPNIDHANSTVLSTTYTATAFTPGMTQISNSTGGGMHITSPAAVVTLPTPITGSFTPGSSISVTADGTSKQAIAPTGSLIPGQQAPTSVLQVTGMSNATALPYMGTGPSGFVGAQDSSTVSSLLSSGTGIASGILSDGGFASSTAGAPSVSAPASFQGGAVIRSSSGVLIMLAVTAFTFVIFL